MPFGCDWTSPSSAENMTFDAFRNKFHPFFFAQVEELHLLHLHTILVSQTLGVMSSEELQSFAAPVCRHDMAPYVAKVTLRAEGYGMEVYGLGCHPSKVSRNALGRGNPRYR